MRCRMTRLSSAGSEACRAETKCTKIAKAGEPGGWRCLSAAVNVAHRSTRLKGGDDRAHVVVVIGGGGSISQHDEGADGDAFCLRSALARCLGGSRRDADIFLAPPPSADSPERSPVVSRWRLPIGSFFIERSTFSAKAELDLSSGEVGVLDITSFADTSANSSRSLARSYSHCADTQSSE